MLLTWLHVVLKGKVNRWLLLQQTLTQLLSRDDPSQVQQYHTELLPDSVLNTESPDDFVESLPNRNAISKVYISRSYERNLKSGDVVVFYRTKADGAAPAHHTAVATTVGIIQNVITRIDSVEQFVSLCRKRSVFSDDKLAEYWNHKSGSRPFIVNFLYVHTFPKRLNLSQLKELQIIREAPRGFELIKDEAFERLMEKSNGNMRLIVD